MAVSFQIILGSSSTYRRTQLATLGLPFECISPDIDESSHAYETPLALARRLALSKATHIARAHPEKIIIGADQVLDLHGTSLGKPHTHNNAAKQLQLLSGQTAIFHSAIALVTPYSRQVAVSSTRATFRKLNATQIQRYLDYDTPYDTAGSAKAESLGIALLENLSSDDPSAIIGLPLITLTSMLLRVGIDPLTYTPKTL